MLKSTHKLIWKLDETSSKIHSNIHETNSILNRATRGLLSAQDRQTYNNSTSIRDQKLDVLKELAKSFLDRGDLKSFPDSIKSMLEVQMRHPDFKEHFLNSIQFRLNEESNIAINKNKHDLALLKDKFSEVAFQCKQGLIALENSGKATVQGDIDLVEAMTDVIQYFHIV